jgi:hypothetical protein
MAPELVSGRSGSATAKTDLWSLGVILYLLLTGQRPFLGSTVGDLSPQILQNEPTPPRKLRPQLHRDLETIVLKSLEKDPRRRYASAGSLAEDLENWLRGEAIAARPISQLGRCARWLRRHPRLTALLCTSALLVLVGAAARYAFAPERPRYALEQQLLRKEPVPFLDEQGRLAWSRWNIRQGVLSHPPDAPDALALASHDTCLLELLPDPQLDSYRLSAQVRHDQGRNGEVGLYVLRSGQVTEDGPEQCYARLTFNDQVAWGAEDPQGKVRKSVAAFDLERYCLSRNSPMSSRLCDRLDNPNVDWRQLVIEVRPHLIQCWWDHVPLEPVPRETLLAHKSHIANQSSSFDPTFAPRQGLGLYVCEARASYRRVLVEPLEEDAVHP